MRSIHNLESSYFRTKFESELPKFKGSSGIGIISIRPAAIDDKLRIWQVRHRHSS